MNDEPDLSRDCKGASRDIRSITQRSLTVAALIVALLPCLNNLTIAADQPTTAQFDGSTSQPATSLSESQRLVRWRLVFFWAIVVVLIFFIAALVIIRFSLRYRAYLFREPNRPTPSEDVWQMHRLPEEEEGPRGPGAEGPGD